MADNNDHIHLGRLQDFYADHKALPPYTKIADICGMRSKAAVFKLVSRLKRDGFLQVAPGARLAPTAQFFARPRVGSAPAGFPSPAAEMLNDALSIDDYLIEHPSQTVLVEVQGDSMIGAGIQPGDHVIVRKCSNADIGQIVVAIMDGDFTIKYLDRDEHGYLLRPANPHYSLLRPERELTIFGVVTGQFRKYPT
jgi:repressor LexA